MTDFESVQWQVQVLPPLLNYYEQKNKCNNRRKIDRPNKDILIKEIKELGYCGTGRKYNVSDNAIRKWLNNQDFKIFKRKKNDKA